VTVKLVNQPLASINADLTLEFITLQQLINHPQKEILAMAGFNAEQEQFCTLHEQRLMVCGMSEITDELFRSTMAKAITSAMGYGYGSLKLSQCGEAHFKALIEGIVLGSHRCDEYKSEPKPTTLKEVIFSHDDSDSENLNALLNRTLIIAKATNFVRDLVNQTPYDMTPQGMAVTAEEIAKSNHLECNILDVNGLHEEKMEAMVAVGRASINPPRLIHLAYKPKNPKKVITLVGKGLTYDSGGLSLKAAASMVTMKMDKAGGCAVMGIIKAVSELGLDIEVHAFVGAVENMIGGNAYKPDDVLIAKNGTTIEVRNTDAEGRLVLADLLGYAQQEVEADYIIDLATLTGACIVGVGEYTSGVMGNNELLINTILYAANKSSGEYATKLAFNRYLAKTLKSEVADISNISNTRYGGAITAGMFLSEFITKENKEKWAHIDIAGPAFIEHAWGENPSGASGAGVRMMTRFIEDLAH